jgi:hypothetical protein
MPLKKPLEQPIINAIIRYAYALRKDEEAALLSAFLVISYHTHRDAVQSMMPAYKYAQLMSTGIPVTSEDESFIETASELTYREPLIIQHIHYVMAIVSSVPGAISSAIIASVNTAITKPVDAAIARLRQSMRFMSRRHRESVLQEEEELALFSTIEGVADQVNREAIESEIRQGMGGNGSFAALYERAQPEPFVAPRAPVKVAVTAREGRNETVKRYGRRRETYIEFMDEELTITRGIIDRNRALSQGYLNSHAV